MLSIKWTNKKPEARPDTLEETATKRAFAVRHARAQPEGDGSNIAEVGVETSIVFRRIVPGLRRVDFVSNCTFCRSSAALRDAARLLLARRFRPSISASHPLRAFREAFLSRPVTARRQARKEITVLGRGYGLSVKNLRTDTANGSTHETILRAVRRTFIYLR